MTFDFATEHRLDEIVARYRLPSPARDRLAALLRSLADDPLAPTTVQRPAEAVDVHVADSLTGLEVPALAAAPTIVDLGSGAGFPGLALAAARPDAEVALVESSARRCEYLERSLGAVDLPLARVARSRAESWEEGLGWADAVTARALAPLPVLLEYAAPLLREGGTLVAWKGRVERDELAAAARAADELGLEGREPHLTKPYASSRSRRLCVFTKAEPTPAGFPRRPGVARKRPLGTAPRP